MKRRVTNEVLLGIGAGYLASKLMDRVTTAYQERQSEASKQREEQLQEVPAYREGCREAGRSPRAGPRPGESRATGTAPPPGPGPLGWGYCRTPASRGMNPLVAGILTGLVLWLLVDEGANALFGLTPPPTAYPRETHVRGLIGHLAYGGTLGILLGVGNMLFLR
jgi:hypothetical protein